MAGAFTTLNIKDGDGTARTMRVWDESGAGTGPFDFVHVLAQKSLPHGANPTAVTEGDRAYWGANRAGVPFVIGGHPNIVTASVTVAAANGAQTDQPVIAVSSGTKVVVTGWSVFTSNVNSGDVDVRLGFSQNSPNTLPNVDTAVRTGVLCDLRGIDQNTIIERGDGAGILGVGADGADLLYTCTSPTAGHVTITVSYYTIES